MPHYPDEIEYSDKYMDDYYEYRHVLLPKDIYKKMPRNRLLLESVNIHKFRNGDPWESSSQEDGFTMSCTDLSLTFCFSGDLWELTLRLDYHPLDLWHLLTHSLKIGRAHV